MNVLSYMISTKTPPRKVTIDKGDDYLMFLLARWIEAHGGFSGCHIQYLKWTKADNKKIRASLEADWVMDARPIYVIQGAPEGWLAEVNVSREVPAVVSQEKNGKLKPDPFDPKNIRSLLLVLKTIHSDKGPWDVHKAAQADWRWASYWSEIEPAIVRMVLLQEETPEVPLSTAIPRGSLLGHVRGCDLAALTILGDRYSWQWLHKALCEETVRASFVKSYTEKGVDRSRLSEVLPDFSWRDEPLIDEAGEWSWDELKNMAQELIIRDWCRSSRPKIELARILLGKNHELTAYFS